MFRSLRARLVLVMILLILLMMAVVFAFLITSVSAYHLNTFATQMSEAFARADFRDTLIEAALSDDPPTAMKERLKAYSGLLGIDTVQRNFYILDANSGAFLDGSDEEKGAVLEFTTAIATVSADNTTAYISQRIGDPYMDAAVPVQGRDHMYIVYIKDTKESQQALIERLIPIIIDMTLVGLALAIALSLILSKAITTPLERLTHGAKRMTEGTFTEGLSVQSDDEIGVLTHTFNHMAQELQRTLEEIGSERDKLGTLFQHLTDGVASFAHDGTPIQVNPAAERLLGLPSAQITSYGQVLGAVTPLFEVLALKDEPRYLQRDCDMNGRRLLVSLAPFGRESTEGVMAVLHDVTRQHRLDELRREFVSNVSHELRTPLTNIRSYSETLLDNENLPPETARSFTQVILTETERMNRLVHDLLTLSRLDYDKMDWHFERFQLEDMLFDVRAAMRLEAERLNHELTFSSPPSLSLMGDRARLEQVVINLLSNALKYTLPGGRVSVSADKSDGYVHIVVEDNGIGIPKSDLPRLFERFYRVDKARSRRSGGTGLGLAIAREIVEAHRGTIRIDSVPDRGTTVTVTLPEEQPVHAAAPPEEQPT